MSSPHAIWNDVGPFYEASLAMKANGGSLLIDDFGRQMVRPIELLNRACKSYFVVDATPASTAARFS